jgi:hypothetical protein
LATYREIQDYIRAAHGFVPQTCWIAHVLADHGRTTRPAPNRLTPDARAKPCPPVKRPAIEAALRHFGMIAG